MSSKITHKNPDYFKLLQKRFKDKYEVAVGLPKGGDSTGKQYPDGTPVLEVAWYNEFGTKTIPARPFLKIGGRLASKALQDELIEVFRSANNGQELRELLGVIGLQATAIVQDTILKLKTPPNAPRTIAKKGSANPLIDTGLLRQSITHQVRKAE